jgi:hypothetical protein
MSDLLNLASFTGVDLNVEEDGDRFVREQIRLGNAGGRQWLEMQLGLRKDLE